MQLRSASGAQCVLKCSGNHSGWSSKEESEGGVHFLCVKKQSIKMLEKSIHTVI